MELLVVGWVPGMRKVSLTHLLARDFDMSIAEGKAVVDLILARGVVDDPEREADDPIRLSEPVVVAVPRGADLSEARAALQELGIVIAEGVDDTP